MVGGTALQHLDFQFGQRRPQNRIVAEDHGPLDKIFQLAHVPRPKPVGEGVNGFGGEGFKMGVLAGGMRGGKRPVRDWASPKSFAKSRLVAAPRRRSTLIVRLPPSRSNS